MRTQKLEKPANRADRANTVNSLACNLRQLKDMPGPRGIPLLGNALQIDVPRFHLQLEQWSRKYGPFFKLQIGKRELLVLGNHQDVTSVLRDRPDGFRRTTNFEEIWTELGMPHGVFGANGEAWKRQRRMVMAAFDPAHVQRYLPSLQTVARRLVGRWQLAAKKGVQIDLQADLMRYTVDTISGLAFGAEVNTLESDDDVIQRHLDKIFPALLKRLLAPVPIWRFIPSAADRQLERSIKEVKSAVDGFILQARERLRVNPLLRENPSNFLESMVNAADEIDRGIDDEQVAGNVLTMLLAGEDTTANTIAWMIYLLWRNPQALTRAIEEVHQVVSDVNHPSIEEIALLNYVEACAHETMRLKPVAPSILLEALHEMVLGDVKVPATTEVLALMRRDSLSDDHLPQAAAFMPERWLDSSAPGSLTNNAAKRLSMPFGAGPRICPGRYLALLEMKMSMIALLGHFSIESIDTPDGQEAREQLAFTMKPQGLSMRLRAL